MPQAVASPEDIERFATDLKAFNNQLQESMGRLNSQFGQLGDTWRDQEHRKFAEEFQQTVRVLERFRQVSETQIPFLIRKAQRLRDYFNQR